MKNEDIQKRGKPKQGTEQVEIKEFNWNAVTQPKTNKP